MKIVKRLIDLKLPGGKSAFLWGPRKVGKTFWIEHHLPKATVLDFLKSNVFAEFSAEPHRLREKFIDHKGLLVIDEVQKIPPVLDEVQWLMDHQNISFLLTGSSARKLRRGQANLLGGRAWRYTMTPLSFMEVAGFDLEKVMTSGLLPLHFLSTDPIADIRSYVSDYLKEEIAAEAAAQNIPSFSEFLRVAAITSSELLNYVNVGRECGMSHKAVRAYFDILEDTYLGFRVQPWRNSRNRRMILTEKFYLFDVGVANYLARRRPLLGSSEFGKSFEHYILMELRAYQAYKNPELPIYFWRTASGQEVDFVVGDRELAIEIKASERVHEGDLRALQALQEDGPVKKRVIVSLEREPRKLSSGIEVIPWRLFLEHLWAGNYV